VKRILVAGAVSEEFTERLVDLARAIRVGDPADLGTEMGTLIDEQAATTVESRVSAAVDAGARLRFGGQRKAAQHWPTVLDRVPPDTPLVAEETFGPIAPVIDIADADDAVAMINAGRFGLQTGIFSRDIETLKRAAHELRVGTVIFNEGPQFSSPAVPFGGVKHSGLGREGARWAMAEMCVTKTVVL
jgi:acyl-CoA reductase-like NAD-dependent aldehyde dehydrogenase